MTVDKIKEIKCFILDMDGTIYLGNQLFDFTKDFLNKVEETGREYYFFTNNSSKSQQAYIDKLGNMGIHIEPKQMMISSHVMIKYLKEKHPGETIYVVGTPSLINEFKTFNMPLVDENPDIVILGFDTTLTYEKISKACHYIRNGCTYYGINPDWNCPMEGGTFIPDCGSMAKLTGYKPEEIAIVGDRLYTDIAVADGSDVTSILVLSGESTLEDVEASDVKPDIILESLKDITEKL